MKQRTVTQRVLAAAVMQAAWREGHRRVRLFCAEELRPSACCIVDALHTRGYEVELLCGPEARAGLQQPATAELLRVVWAPEGTDRGTRSRLREALDPDAAGDVLVLGSPTPRGVIDAIDAFGAPLRKRRLRASPRKTYLAQPTLMERQIELRHWTSSGLGAGAIAIALIGGLWVGARAPEPVTAQRTAAPAVEAMVAPPRAAEPVLASARTEPSLDDAFDDEEPIILEEVPRRRAPAREPAALDEEALAPAPLETGVRAVRPAPPPSLLPAAMARMPEAPRTAPYAIDPF